MYHLPQTRQLVKDGFLVEVSEGSRKLRHVFLFTDVLLCAKLKKTSAGGVCRMGGCSAARPCPLWSPSATGGRLHFFSPFKKHINFILLHSLFLKINHGFNCKDNATRLQKKQKTKKPVTHLNVSIGLLLLYFLPVF